MERIIKYQDIRVSYIGNLLFPKTLSYIAVIGIHIVCHRRASQLGFGRYIPVKHEIDIRFCNGIYIESVQLILGNSLLFLSQFTKILCIYAFPYPKRVGICIAI